ncbi:hypothetical protein ACFP7A_00855 [Sporolactobacillus kofuensis]|uniref:HNH endonuclease n=1 Tax=Sporolactobacillus kofuensis TaxID=269672 RepID=A0ABW1WBS0_9BACL|nr:hypothetical protein [Sporolactobacillus kofuensis]MCO7175548.1 hypothetical protein [Sporolactobacillus kofuensis]
MDQRREQSDKYRHRRYNRQRTDKREQQFYKSRQWEQLRQYLAGYYHGLCVYSYLVEHKIVPYYTMHHIIPVKDDWSKRFNSNCIIPLCESVHQRVEKAYREGRKKETQEQLFELLKRWRDGAGGTEKV